MKKGLLFIAGLLFPAFAMAQQADTSFSQLLVDKLKEARPVVLMSPYQKPAYAGFLPIHTFHSIYDKDLSGKDIVDPMRDYLEIGGGGKYETGTKSGDGFAAVDFNAVALVARAYSFPWAQSHVRRSPFPPIFIGGGLVAPLDYHGLQTINFKRDARVIASVIYKW